MDSTWLFALLGFAAGILVGVIICRLAGSSGTKAGKLKQELTDLQKEHANYKEEVAGHFSKTSELVEDLTSNYVKVYKHLAAGATQLADIQPAELLISQPQEDPQAGIANKTEDAASDEDNSQFEPPKDYAPKKDGANGTLSESFSTASTSTDVKNKAPDPT